MRESGVFQGKADVEGDTGVEAEGFVHSVLFALSIIHVGKKGQRY